MPAIIHLVIDDATAARIVLAMQALGMTKEQLCAAGLESILRVAEKKHQSSPVYQKGAQESLDS